MKEKKAKHEFAYDREKNFSFFTNTEIVHGFSTTDRGNMLIGSCRGAEKEEIVKRLNNFCSDVGVKEENRVLMIPHITGNIAVVDKKAAAEKSINADALITENPEAVLSVKSADCPPIIVTAKNERILALINGGFISLKDEIIRRTIKKIKKLASNPQLQTFIGPGICKNCYQQSLLRVLRLKIFQRKWRPYLIGGRLDLVGYIKNQLKEQGINEIYESGICTLESPHFFSHRGAEKDEDRFLTIVSLKNRRR